MKMELKKEQLFKESNIIILVMAILAYMLFQRARMGGLLFGNEAYYHLMVADKISDAPRILFENIYLREYLITPFHAILAIYPSPLSAQILSTVFALGSAAIFYLIIKKLIREETGYSMMLLASSTMFIYLMVFTNSESFSALITLLIILFYIEEKEIAFATNILLLILFPPFYSAILLALYFIHRQKTLIQKKAGKYLVAAFAISSLIHPLFFYQYEHHNAFSDFGSYAGISFIILLFGLAGTIARWKDAKWYALLFTGVFAASYSYSGMNVYVNFFLVFMGGATLAILLKHKWADKSIRTLMFLVLFSSILFSTLSYMNFAKNADPKKEVYDALSKFAEDMHSGKYPEGILLTTKEKSILGSYFGLDPFIRISEDSASKENITKEIFESRNLDKTRRLLEINSITYILIDKDLASALGQDEGMLFLLRNEEAFEKVHKNNQTAIWRYKKLFQKQ